MRRFLITGQKFTGEAEAIYNDQEMIACVDVRNTNMNAPQRSMFLASVPNMITGLADAFGKKLTIVEAEFTLTFEMWYNDYNLKRNKKDALAIWNRTSKTKQIKAWTRNKAYDQYLKRNSWQNKMYPDTYLRGEHYEDEWEKL